MLAVRRASRLRDATDLDDARVSRLELVGFVTVADAARSSGYRTDRSAPTRRHRGRDAHRRSSEHRRDDRDGVRAPRRRRHLGPAARSDDRCPARCLVVAGTTVFARVTPAHKVRIVQAFQRHGRVVAMAGDGANDAQAIRLADIGVAFGSRRHVRGSRRGRSRRRRRSRRDPHHVDHRGARDVGVRARRARAPPRRQPR